MRKGFVNVPVVAGEKPEDRVAAFRAANLTFFWVPYLWQRRVLDAIRDKSTVAVISSNKIGKTACVVNILISWLLGYEPWTKLEEESEDSVCIWAEQGGRRFPVYYRKSSLGIKPPVNIIFTGEDWKLHIGRVLVPEVKKWAPQGWYETKKNEQGTEYYWQWNNKSTLTIMSYSQDDDLFE